MDKLEINVNIGNRTYPLTIDRKEEELIRLAAKRVNDNMKQLESTYAVNDKQDLLAMTALFFSNKSLEANNQLSDISNEVEQKLTDIELAIESSLKQA